MQRCSPLLVDAVRVCAELEKLLHTLVEPGGRSNVQRRRVHLRVVLGVDGDLWSVLPAVDHVLRRREGLETVLVAMEHRHAAVENGGALAARVLPVVVARVDATETWSHEWDLELREDKLRQRHDVGSCVSLFEIRLELLDVSERERVAARSFGDGLFRAHLLMATLPVLFLAILGTVARNLAAGALLRRGGRQGSLARQRVADPHTEHVDNVGLSHELCQVHRRDPSPCHCPYAGAPGH
mmetsp:Transcript_13360/g.28788  ORF Transcript_13360/g.28788 Transcript_13360/m.28788 type:complete len:240 (-) Transcript_13360:1518-2237(-)